VLAAIGICPLAAISGYPETASFVTERDYGFLAWPRRNRLVRSSLAAVRIGAGSDVVLACVSSSFTGFADDSAFCNSVNDVARYCTHDDTRRQRPGD
jgi:hypothetical protein